ncbi:MAG: UvrD-helicase domain-containing protein [Actinomycetota bacterium]
MITTPNSVSTLTGNGGQPGIDTSTDLATRSPDWDLEQLEVIMAESSEWQLVLAGPGAGKSAVACQRIAFLIDDGVPPSRILLVSFTRTAVAELRERIIRYSMVGEKAKSVRITTLDSHAWTLRAGFDDLSTKSFIDSSYNLNIAQTVDLFRKAEPDLIEFMKQIEHVILDEAQDIVGIRADLIMEILASLSAMCGVTILADPGQAIYGFTTDARDTEVHSDSVLQLLAARAPKPLVERTLVNNHRVEDDQLMKVFAQARKQIESDKHEPGHVERVKTTIAESCGTKVELTTYSSIAEFLQENGNDSMLVLFRRRADVLFASSYCSDRGIQHRLRMSGVPTILRPWLGWLFGEWTDPYITRDEFDTRWTSQSIKAAAPFAQEDRDADWNLLHRYAAGRRASTIDLEHLRLLLSRLRPPVEFCVPDLGTSGPILGTIHASKGREADNVVLLMPFMAEDQSGYRGTEDALLEEGRVYYVGATRARRMLIATSCHQTQVSYLESDRIYKRLTPANAGARAQMEVGRDGDVDRLSHLTWSNGLVIQDFLASVSGGTLRASIDSSRPEIDYAPRIILEKQREDGVTTDLVEVGEMSTQFRSDLGKLWGRIDRQGVLRPASTIHNVHLIGVTTVALTEAERNPVRAPFNESGFALAPVIMGVPMIPFLYRRKARY